MATNAVAYTYDAIGQLKTALGTEAGGVTPRLHEQLGYAYDAAGNLNRRTNNGFIQSFNVNTLNQLTTVTQAGRYTVAGGLTTLATNVTVNTTNALRYADATFAATNFTLANGANTFTAIAKDIAGRADTNATTVALLATNTYVYDQNGNLRTNGARIYDYDDENQLIRITQTNAWKSEFTYDGQRRRRIAKEYTWQGGGWVQTNETRFVYDATLVIQERDSNNVAQVSYTRGTDLSGGRQGAGGIGGLLARSATLSTNNSQLATAFYHADGNGNIAALVSGSQVVVARYLYDSFGNTLSQSGPLAEANTYRFSTKQIHPVSGLYDYLYCWYAPELQRFINRDPIEERGGLNLFGLVGNNPVNDFDPAGLDNFSAPLAGNNAVPDLVGIYDPCNGNGSLFYRPGVDFWNIVPTPFDLYGIFTPFNTLRDVGVAFDGDGDPRERAWASVNTSLHLSMLLGFTGGGVKGRMTVYSAVENGVTRYVGITDNLAARAAAQLREKGIVINEIPGLTDLVRADAKAIEQVLIEANGLGRNGGTLLNKINSISLNNPIYQQSIQRGKILLRQAGHPGI